MVTSIPHAEVNTDLRNAPANRGWGRRMEGDVGREESPAMSLSPAACVATVRRWNCAFRAAEALGGIFRMLVGQRKP